MKKLLLVAGMAFTFSAYTQITPATTSQASSTTAIAESDRDILVLYPNPTREAFKIRYSGTGPITEVSIRDVDGRKVKTYDKPKPEKFFITDLPAGIYIVDVLAGGETISRRLIIEY